MAKDTFYFSHDYNSRNDIKIKKLIAKHGFLGYGLFWAIIEDLYNNANALPTDYECIAFDLRTDAEIVKSIVLDFDLFIIEEEKFGSSSVERRLDERNEKSVKARESAFKRWGNMKDDANALPTECDSNAIKERKGKEMKEKKEEIITVFSFEDFWKVYPVKSGKIESEKKFSKISEKDRLIIKNSIDDFVKNKPFKDYTHPNPTTYINQKRWLDNVNETKKSIPPFEFDFKKHGGDMNLFHKQKLEHEQKYS